MNKYRNNRNFCYGRELILPESPPFFWAVSPFKINEKSLGFGNPQWECRPFFMLEDKEVTVVVNEVKKEFLDHVIPFWEKLIDENNEGYYGLLDYDLKLDKTAEKG